MDNIQNLTKSANIINDMYNDLSYFDLYGTSVIIFIFITLIVAFACIYSIVMKNAQPIKDNWEQQRCSPIVIPFAGFINKPDNQTISQFTSQNFSFCLQSILTNITGTALQPFNFLIGSLTNIFSELGGALNQIRNVTNTMRNNISNIAENIFSRIANIIVPLQEIMIAFMDSINKTQGILTAGLFTAMGTYNTLQALMGAIMQFISKILVILVGIIVALWVMPFTWPVAATTSGIFVVFAAVTTTMLVFMREAMGLKGLPGVPKLRCFDGNTILQMNDGTQKLISEVEPGEILADGNKITAKMIVDSNGLNMYLLDNIVISESHIVKFGNEWIPVRSHPNRLLIPDYNYPYLYCLNTTKKIIKINNTIFSDWDEVYNDTLTKLLNEKITNSNSTIQYPEHIHIHLGTGLVPESQIKLKNNVTIQIQKVKVGDILKYGEKVYGIIEIDGSDLDIFEYSLGQNDKIIGGPNLILFSENEGIYSTLDLDNSKKTKITRHYNKLYHILTSPSLFSVNSHIIFDYNASIDFILQK